MARVLVAAQTTVGAYPTTAQVAANQRDLSMQACDASLGNYTPIVEGKSLILCQNTGAGARTITFYAQPDSPYNRSVDITAYSLGAGELGLFGPFKLNGWSDGGNLDFTASHAEMLVAVITLP